MSTHNEKASWLAGLLTGWGIKESWAKIIAGAIIGAAAAAGLLQAGCKNITPEQLQGTHNAYHAATGKPCIFVIQSGK